ncbi:competence protein ComEA [Cupriavidus sp. YR651]|uniref:ComEA family DNA-binding protein n=1 Tax=Cupriavidus sp. YR651 TaxID=1855315 RepID=UPI000885DDF3|nr:helix-hairpin-helix domain-containing protein [Cupriavidus sp. YR651]SDC53365.1 competence protein ComEA [Cupriavidus sp. YR651]
MRKSSDHRSFNTSLFRCIRRAGAVLAMSVAIAGTAYAEVDVNAADEAALTAVKGIGPATAKRIVEERGKGGAFKDANDLADRVPGVGPKSVANLQEAGLSFGKTAATAAVARKDTKPAPKAQR